MSTTPIKRYYPPISELVTLPDFPDGLQFVKDTITNYLDQIHYKDLEVSRSINGDSTFWKVKNIKIEGC